MLIFAGVDGTGAAVFANDRNAYFDTYQSSHISKMCRFTCWDRTNYDRGPGVAGVETGRLAQGAFDHVVRFWDSSNCKVFLAGFSRGAAAVIETAKMLKRFDIPVECLILFDPVDRSHVGGVGGGHIVPGPDTPIVSTVSHCIKILRHPASASRESFGNCGNQFESASTKIYPTIIPCTHGGVGGTPWPASYVAPGQSFINEGPPDGITRVTLAQDRAGSDFSWSFANAMLQPIIDNAKLAVGDATAPTRTEVYVPGRTQINIRCMHTVKRGESLSLIAMQYYGSFKRWSDIYQANLDRIGSNPNAIEPNWELIIPV